MDTTIKLKEIATALDQDPYNVKRKCANKLNGSFMGDRLTLDQASIILTDYTQGRGKLKGEKLQRLISYAESKGIPVESKGFAVEKPTGIDSTNRSTDAHIQRSTSRSTIRSTSKKRHVQSTFNNNLEYYGGELSTALSSTLVIFAYYITAIAAEAYLQAELFVEMIQSSFLPMFICCFAVLFSLVFAALTKKDSSLLSWEERSHVKRNFITKNIKASPTFQVAFFVYNVILCEARFFQKADPETVLEKTVLIASGLVIPLVISYIGLILKVRIDPK